MNFIRQFCLFACSASILAPNMVLADGNREGIEANQIEAAGLEFIGEATFSTGLSFENTEVGGLSGIDYDVKNDIYYVISDDRSNINDARFYTLTIDLSDGALEDGDIAFTDVITILDKAGNPFPPSSVDPEAIRLDPRTETLYWTSEGDANALIAPFIREMTLDGEFIREFTPPEKYEPTADGDNGIRNNLAFESLTFALGRKLLITATENALVQDGPEASITEGSPSRWLSFSVRSGDPNLEFVYEVDPVAAEPIPADAFSTNGLVDILAINNRKFLAVERSFSVGVGNGILIYRVTVEEATDVSRFNSIEEAPQVTPVTKELLLDLGDLGITLDNIEGATFGPILPNGQRSLILVSDNNFNTDGQFTQFLAFAVLDSEDLETE